MSQLPKQPHQPLPTARITFGFNESTMAWLGLAILLAGGLLWANSGRISENTDFSMTYVGAQIIYQGNYAHLYDLHEQVRLRNILYKKASPILFEHPPFEAFLLAPLATLPYKSAYLLWGIFNALIWLSLPYILRPFAHAPRETLGYFALWFLFAPLGDALFQGQSSLLVLFFYTLAYTRLKRGQDLQAGMWLGLGLFKFQFVIPFALIFILRKQWKFVAGFALVGTFLGVLSLFAVGWHGILRYIRFLLTIAGHPQDAAYGNSMGMATVHGFLSVALRRWTSPQGGAIIAAAISIALLVYVAWRWNQEDDHHRGRSFDIMFAVAIVVSLSAGSHMFMHDLSPLIISLLLVAAHFPGRQRPLLRVILATSLAIFWCPPILIGLMALKGFYLLLPPLLIFAYSALRLVENPIPAVLRAD